MCGLRIHLPTVWNPLQELQQFANSRNSQALLDMTLICHLTKYYTSSTIVGEAVTNGIQWKVIINLLTITILNNLYDTAVVQSWNVLHQILKTRGKVLSWEYRSPRKRNSPGEWSWITDQPGRGDTWWVVVNYGLDLDYWTFYGQ